MLNEIKDRIRNQNAQLKEELNKKEYLVTVFEDGWHCMGIKRENRICPRRYYKVCSLEEIAETIGFMKQGFWRHPDLRKDTSEKNVKKIKYEEKQWGINTRIVIEPLTKELQDAYLRKVESKFLDTWRDYAEMSDHHNTDEVVS